MLRWFAWKEGFLGWVWVGIGLGWVGAGWLDWSWCCCWPWGTAIPADGKPNRKDLTMACRLSHESISQ